MGLKLFLHSVRMVFDHLGEALRISGLLYLIYIAMAWASFTYGYGSGSAEFLLPSILAMLAGVVLFFWIAIAWHRFILLDDVPGAILPNFRGGNILTYAGNGLLVMFCLLPIFIVTGILFGIVAAMGGSPVLMIIVFLMSAVAFLVVSYRLAPVLPATAIDQPISLGRAWSSTRNATGAILLMAVISTIASFLVDFPSTLLASLPSGALLAIGWLVLTGWLKVIVGVSILTTIYGHYVEGREVG